MSLPWAYANGTRSFATGRKVDESSATVGSFPRPDKPLELYEFEVHRNVTACAVALLHSKAPDDHWQQHPFHFSATVQVFRCRAARSAARCGRRSASWTWTCRCIRPLRCGPTLNSEPWTAPPRAKYGIANDDVMSVPETEWRLGPVLPFI